MIEFEREFESFVSARTIVQVGDPIYSESATTVRLQDEGAGLFVEVEQESGKIRIGPDDWPTILATIESAMALCKERNEKKGESA